MIQFHFNKWMPLTASKEDLTECLKNSIIAFRDIKMKYGEDVQGITTIDADNTTVLNESEEISLADIIQNLDRDGRNVALAFFLKPMVLQVESYVNIRMDSQEIRIPQFVPNRDMLFSLAVFEELRENILTFVTEDREPIDIHNLWGDDENTTYIKTKIGEIVQSGLPLQNLTKIFEGKCKMEYSKNFKGNYNQLTSEIQKKIEKGFSEFIEIFRVDDDLVRPVDAGKCGKKHPVLELRILEPSPGWRVYFHIRKTDNFIYCASVKEKTKNQSEDIKNACRDIKSYFENQ